MQVLIKCIHAVAWLIFTSCISEVDVTLLEKKKSENLYLAKNNISKINIVDKIVVYFGEVNTLFSLKKKLMINIRTFRLSGN